MSRPEVSKKAQRSWDKVTGTRAEQRAAKLARETKGRAKRVKADTRDMVKQIKRVTKR